MTPEEMGIEEGVFVPPMPTRRIEGVWMDKATWERQRDTIQGLRAALQDAASAWTIEEARSILRQALTTSEESR